MIGWKLIAAVLLALAVHPYVLRTATRLMVEVLVPYAKALQIVAIEYVAAGVVLALLSFLKLTGQTIALAAAAIILVAVGATLIGKWLSFHDGDRLGIGNGILIQFMQVPLAIPFLILASFLFDPTK
jgi:hypothetical protein